MKNAEANRVPSPPPAPKGRCLQCYYEFFKHSKRHVKVRECKECELKGWFFSKYRIKQTAADCFEVQKLFYTTTTTGVLFWKKKKDEFMYHTIDRLERKLFFYHKIGIGNKKELLIFKTLKKAQKAIQDLNKYPIIHNCY